MTEKQINEKRTRDQKIYNLQIELYQTIPDWWRLILAGFIDIIFCMAIPMMLIFTYFLPSEGESTHNILIAFLIIGFILIDFLFSTRAHGSTIGMFITGVFLVREYPFEPVDSGDVIEMLFLGVKTDIIYTDFYETLSFLSSSKKQTIAMKRNHIIYVTKRKYKNFYNARKEEIKALYQEYYY